MKNQTKKKGSLLKLFGATAMASIMALGVGCAMLPESNVVEPNSTSKIEAPAYTAGSTIKTEMHNNASLTLFSTEPTVVYSEQGNYYEQTITAYVYPITAEQKVDWSIDWAEESSGDINSYFELSIVNDNTAKLLCLLGDFNPAILTATAVSNPDIKACSSVIWKGLPTILDIEYVGDFYESTFVDNGIWHLLPNENSEFNLFLKNDLGNSTMEVYDNIIVSAEVNDVEIGWTNCLEDGTIVSTGQPVYISKLKVVPSSNTSGSIVLYFGTPDEPLDFIPEIVIANYSYSSAGFILEVNEAIQNKIVSYTISGLTKYCRFATRLQSDFDYLFKLIFTEPESGFSDEIKFNVNISTESLELSQDEIVF